MPKKGKPEAFGDKHRRCVISSIAGYEVTTLGGIKIHLKSGETIDLQFEVDYLAEKAMTRLDAYFAVDTPESDACSLCRRKDLDDPETQDGYTYCNSCSDRTLDEFRPPDADPHAAEAENE